jgi:hypothetical protein
MEDIPKRAPPNALDSFWKAVLLTIGFSQIATVALGLWVANDLYAWSRWSADGKPPLHSYFGTDAGMNVLIAVVAWALVAAGVVGGGYLKSRVDR